MNDLVNLLNFARGARERPKLRQKMALGVLKLDSLGPETQDLDVGIAPHLGARTTPNPLGRLGRLGRRDFRVLMRFGSAFLLGGRCRESRGSPARNRPVRG